MPRPRESAEIVKRSAVVIVSAASAAALLAWAVAGWSSRYAADDFCTAGTLQTFGFWKHQAYWYAGWSGRFAAYFAISAAQSLGPQFVRVLPSLLLIAWVAAAAWMLAPLADRRMSIAFALVTVFAALRVSGATSEVLHWETGSLTYALPQILTCVMAGLMLRRKSPAAIGVLAFVIAGFSETQAAFQFALVIAAMLFTAERRALYAAAAGTLIASIIIIASPGNLNRLQQMHSVHSLRSVASALTAGIYLPAAMIVSPTLAALFAFAAGTLLPPIPLRRAVVVAAIVIVTVACLPAAVAFADFPPPRARLVFEFFLVCLFAIAGSRVNVRQRALVAIVAALIPLVSAYQTIASLAERRAWARAWDARDARLRAGATTFEPLGFTPLAPDPPHSDPRFWINECLGSYYNLENVSARVPARPLRPEERAAIHLPRLP